MFNSPVCLSASCDAELGKNQHLPDRGAIARAVSDTRMHPIALRILGHEDVPSRRGQGNGGATLPHSGRVLRLSKNLGESEIARRWVPRIEKPGEGRGRNR